MKNLRPFLLRGLLVLTVFGVLMGVWNWPILESVARPTAQRLHIFPEPKNYDLSKDQVVYPSLGIVAPLQAFPRTSPLNYQDWDSIRSALRQGVSMNYAAETFSEAGLAYITGHSSDSYPHEYASVFASLGQAKTGDQFLVIEEGRAWRYTVADIRVVDPQNVLGFSEGVLAGKDNVSTVALVTCWPLLTTAQRLVVVGERQAE